jgi:hypothetical protein
MWNETGNMYQVFEMENGVIVMKVCHLSVTQSDTVGEGWISVYIELNTLKDKNGKILQARIAWEAVSYSL